MTEVGDQRSDVRGSAAAKAMADRQGSDDLFSWGKRLAAISENPGQVAVLNANQIGKTHALKQHRVQQMVGELERVRILHWEHFRERFGWSDRVCRDVASFSEGVIISFSGGYVLNRRATDAEFGEANGRIRSQGEKMLARADREMAVRHRLVGRAVTA